MRVFIVWVIACMLLLGQEGAAQQLYPYKAGKLHGYCTQDKKMVIPAAYIMTEANSHFYICVDSTGLKRLYNAQAQLVDSARYQMYPLNNNRTLLIDAYDTRKMIEMLIQAQNSDRRPEWMPLAASHARIIDSIGNKLIIPDTIVSIHESHNWLKTRNGALQGIYNLTQQEYLIEPTSDSIYTIPHKYIVKYNPTYKCIAYTLTGQAYSIPPVASNLAEILNDGQLIATQPIAGNHGALYNSQDALIMDQQMNWGKLIYPNNSIKALWVKQNVKYDPKGNHMALHSMDGTFIKDVQNATEWLKDLLLVTIIDTNQPATTNTYLYNVVKNTWKKVHSAPLVKPEMNSYNTNNQVLATEAPFLSIKYPEYRVYLNGFNGKKMFTIYDTVWGHKPLKQRMGYLQQTQYLDGAWQKVYHRYVRKKLDGNFTLYSPELKVVNKKYDSIAPLRILGEKFAIVKSNGHYGLINSTMKETIPATYDQLDFKNSHYAKVKKNGRTYWIDTADNEVFGGTAFDYISDYSVNGKWLAYSYKAPPAYWRTNNYEYTEVAKAYLINAQGNILNTWDAGNTANTAYMLTVNGKILRYPAPNSHATCGMLLYDPETKKIDSLPHTYRDIKTYKNAAIIIQCINTDREMAIFSALDFSMVLPYSNYEEYSGLNVKEITPIQPGGPEGITFHAARKYYETETDSKFPHSNTYYRLIGGFFSNAGVKYWDKASEQ